MDRWSNEDSFERGPHGPAGRVARLGIGGFVAPKSTAETRKDDNEPPPKIEVVASRREQRREKLEAAPPAPPVAAPAAAAQAPALPPPPWASQPPPGWTLQICKDGEVLQEISLSRASCLFGRGTNADVVVDHPSCSRQHAQLGFRQESQSWGAVDLGSTHGTFIDAVRLKPGKASEVGSQSRLQLGASTRSYAVQPPLRAGSKRSAGPDSSSDARRKSVRFGESGGLEQIIGYSDGRSFAVNVGPVANDGSLEGQFSSAVEAPALDAGMKGKTGAQVDGIARRTPKPAQKPDAAVARRPQPLMKRLSENLYGDLPIPNRD